MNVACAEYKMHGDCDNVYDNEASLPSSICPCLFLYLFWSANVTPDTALTFTQQSESETLEIIVDVLKIIFFNRITAGILMAVSRLQHQEGLEIPQAS